MRRCQIITRDQPTQAEPEPKWSFVAHGARYDDAEADRTIAQIIANGRIARKVKV